MIRLSLQTKIITVIIFIILFITTMLTGIYAYFESEEIEENIGNTALRIATTVSLIPAIKSSFELDDPSIVIQPLAEKIRGIVGAEFIVIGNKENVRYSHPDVNKIGKKMVGGDNELALLHGEHYLSKATGSLGPSLRGKAPIIDDTGEIIGVVSVGFLIKDIREIIFGTILKISRIAIVILLLGTLGGILLARNIRKDTLGLEPHQIASLYRERNAVLLSIKEGIIAVDAQGRITMINHSAKELLAIKDDCVNDMIIDVFPQSKLLEIFMSDHTDQDIEIEINDLVLIVNRTPIIEDNQIVGVVASFRNKTDLQKMVDTIFEIRRYSEDLRAQTHEYTNKLYVLSGLLQLGHYHEAIQMIQNEYIQQESQNKILFDQIHDQTVQAILLGKISTSSEKKITFIIDDNSSLDLLPKHINPSDIIIIIGNLIDNAFEAIDRQSLKEVTFFITDIGNDIVIEVSDNGPGIQDDRFHAIFKKGYSTKGSNQHGFGLTNVKKTVESLSGIIETKNQIQGGAIFTIFLPKKIDGIGKEQ
ncbi:ATP-binding protein [Alkalihalobacillus deserti]|uniref:ATP-binding protein n=1 Tax=Alkalihalobacillus deserti TaxID=2879466 RepID=UPI001D13C570|nr:sensor histidine kinase [Alkalihalobacillus deserti]